MVTRQAKGSDISTIFDDPTVQNGDRREEVRDFGLRFKRLRVGSLNI